MNGTNIIRVVSTGVDTTIRGLTSPKLRKRAAKTPGLAIRIITASSEPDVEVLELPGTGKLASEHERLQDSRGGRPQ
jgi:hypothetical protein